MKSILFPLKWTMFLPMAGALFCVRTFEFELNVMVPTRTFACISLDGNRTMMDGKKYFLCLFWLKLVLSALLYSSERIPSFSFLFQFTHSKQYVSHTFWTSHCMRKTVRVIYKSAATAMLFLQTLGEKYTFNEKNYLTEWLPTQWRAERKFRRNAIIYDLFSHLLLES